MTSRPARAAAAVLGLAALTWLGAGTSDASPRAGVNDGRIAVVVLTNGPAFEDVMQAPGFQDVARAGGAAVMSVRTVPGDAGPGHELTLGTGVRSEVPFSPVQVSTVGDSAIVQGFDRIVAANRGRSEPGLLGSVLEAHGLSACSFGDPAALVAMDRTGVANASGGCDLKVYDLSLTPAISADPARRREATDRLSAELAILVPQAPRVLLMVLGHRS